MTPYPDPTAEKEQMPATPNGIWNAIFQAPALSTPLAQPASPSFGAAQQPAPAAPPSLATLAAGGMNHAQQWTAAAAGQPIQSAPRPPLAQPASPEIDPDLLKRFGWSSAFRQ